MSREGSHPSKRCPRQSGGSRSGTTLYSLAGLLLTRISTVRIWTRARDCLPCRPNMRVQRTRMRSPVMHRPLGGLKLGVGFGCPQARGRFALHVLKSHLGESLGDGCEPSHSTSGRNDGTLILT